MCFVHHVGGGLHDRQRVAVKVHELRRPPDPQS